MFTSPVLRRHGSERAWTEHLATNGGASALLDSIARAPLPDAVTLTLDIVRAALLAEVATCVTHQYHLGGRYPDVVIDDPRGQLFAVIEAQRGRADDRHIAKLAGRYVPESGARLGVLVTEGWDPSNARHPAWASCPEPVVALVAFDALHEIDYQPVWVHRPG